MAIYDKTGMSLSSKTLTAWFVNLQGQIGPAKIFDPKTLWDQHANRWVLVAVALHESQDQSWFLISISQTDDPLGSWWNYALDATLDGDQITDNWADYPGIGVDHQALYLTANMFQFGGDFQYSKLRIIPKDGGSPGTGPYSGGTISFDDLVGMTNPDGSLAFTMQPCHTYGAPQVLYLVNSIYPTLQQPTPDTLTLWSLTDPLGTPTLTSSSVKTAPYGIPPSAPQPSSSALLDTGDTRVLNAVFRGGSVWCALTTQQDWGDGANVAAVHWFQLNPASGTLVQQSIYGAASLYYYYPSVMPDTQGSMLAVFCRSAQNEFASIYFAGRRSSDPLGTLGASVLVHAGVDSYGTLSSNPNRWGDYNGVAIDPVDGRFWFYSMFGDTGGSWNTWIGSAS